MNKPRIFTAGYTSRGFFEKAVGHPDVKRVVDCRTSARSSVAIFSNPDFKTRIEFKKPYVHLPLLGGKGEVPADIFENELKEIREGDLLVCMEADADKCHRKYKLTPPLEAKGFEVVHLLQKTAEEKAKAEEKLRPKPKAVAVDPAHQMKLI